MAEIRVLFLGSGTSTGVPMIGCDCATCKSVNPKDKRLRSSVLMRWEDGGIERSVLIDTSTDLRQQALNNDLKRIDSVLFTHAHADHIHGIDELRSFNYLQNQIIPCYGSEHTLSRIKTMFDYIFTGTEPGGGKPRLSLHPVSGGFDLFGRRVESLPAMHGKLEVFGYRVGSVAYITDCNFIPETTLKKMEGVKLLVIGAVQISRHVTHFKIDEAIDISRRVGAEKTYLTHLNHQIKHDVVSCTLPENVFLAYDGLEKVSG
ncbi:MAG: MBL fold metallo-hydrolase [Nitrospinota bacterium]|nr:MBL fold metallo-hydrolase [Nitrospinota bacterium]